MHTFPQNFKLAQLIGLAAQGSLNTAYVSPFASSGVGGDAQRAVFELWIGVLSSGTVDFALWQATSSGGAGRKAIVGAALTQITTTTDVSINTIEIGPGALDDKNGFTWVRGEVTVSTGTPIWGVQQWNYWLRYPGIGGQDATYAQQVLVLGQN